MMASPSTILGIGQPQTGKRNGPVTIRYRDDEPADDTAALPAVTADDDEFDMFAGYGPEMAVHTGSVQIGDLIQLDDAPGHWAAVDADPDEGMDDDQCIVLPWRDDADQEGLLSVPRSDTVAVRRFIEQD